MPSTACPHRWEHVQRVESKVSAVLGHTTARLRLKCEVCGQERTITSQAKPRKT